jgi:moderate conductance mechanosensitive channel
VNSNPTWPQLALALALALVGAYVIADRAGRWLEATLHTLIADERERHLVDRSRRAIRILIFLISGAALSLIMLRLIGYHPTIGRNPDVFAERVFSSGLHIALIAVAAFIVVRVGSAAIRRLQHEMSTGSGLNVIERTKRAQTLGQLLQSALVVIVSVIAGLTVLQELGVDTTAALAGAGIVGLAVGFGAQTLVRDVISGFFLILEDQVRVGDIAVVNGQGGFVESVNLRTIVLRDDEGTVHVFPNGEVKTLANKSKDFSYYVVSVNVAYDEDPERVIAAMKEAAATLMDDSNLRVHILEPLEVFGVDAFEQTYLVVKTRIKTVPMKQWIVGRELRRRVAQTFREKGISIAVPAAAPPVRKT